MNEEGCGAMMGLTVMGFILGCCVGNSCTNVGWRETLVKKGYAEYNSRNGAWQWKEPLHGLQPRTSETAVQAQQEGGAGK